MNYYGINRRVLVPSTKWEGPATKLISKEKEKWLDEEITVIKTFGSMSLEAEHVIRRAFYHYKEKYPNVNVYTTREGFTQNIVLVGPRRVLADEE